jgi:hypothetical protein
LIRHLLQDPEPLQRLRLIRRHNMSKAMTPDTLQPVSIDVLCEFISWDVVLRLRRVSRVPKDAGPLLDRLVEARNIERLIDVTMEDLHAGILARVAGVHGVYLLGPLSGCLMRLASSALGVPAAHSARVEATCRLAAEFRSCGEEIRVDGGHDLLWIDLAKIMITMWIRNTNRHHGARRLAGNIYLAGIAVVLLQRILDHVGQSCAIAAAIVRQGLLGRYVPACTIRGCLSIYENVSMLICELAVFCGCKEVVGCPCACVKNQYDRGLGLQLLRYVDEHLDAGGIGAEVLDLCEGCALDKFMVGSYGCTLDGADGHQACDEG